MKANREVVSTANCNNSKIPTTKERLGTQLYKCFTTNHTNTTIKFQKMIEKVPSLPLKPKQAYRENMELGA